METLAPFRIAYCILCHKYTPVLEELVRQLDEPGNELFIHVDGKSRIEDFAPLRNRTNIHFVEPRTKIYWGGFGMIESTLRLFTATRSGNYHYIILLSGDTLPLYRPNEIRAFLEKAYAEGREFMHTTTSITLEEVGWIRQRRFFADKSTLMRRIKRIFMKCFMRQDNPYFNRMPPLTRGSQWIAVTDHLRDHIFDYLATHPDYYKAFRYSHCADESFFQTLLGDTPFAGRNTNHSLVHTDWSQGGAHPKMFTTDDLPLMATLRSSRKGADTGPLFVRKIDDGLDIVRYREIVLGEKSAAPHN